jgi:hypothetical protein
MQVIETNNVPVKAWVDGVAFEDAARRQVENVASLPFVYKHVAVMPDVHWGMGATVGSVMATRGAIIPAAVGVDIGCGMVAARLDVQASDRRSHGRPEGPRRGRPRAQAGSVRQRMILIHGPGFPSLYRHGQAR